MGSRNTAALEVERHCVPNRVTRAAYACRAYPDLFCQAPQHPSSDKEPIVRSRPNYERAAVPLMRELDQMAHR